MGEERDKGWLLAAECAARTGLTVRALRLYERKGLISPTRTASGWRRYGAADLARVNTIVVLKTLGLSLLQIKDLFSQQLPSLSRVLEVRAESLRARRVAIDRTLTLVELAQLRLRAQKTLSVDDLCDLIRDLATNRSAEMLSDNALLLRIMNEDITPEEQVAWTLWWAEHPEDMAQTQLFAGAQSQLLSELQLFAEQGRDPLSPEVQTLIEQHNELLTKYNVRERQLRQLDWNAPVTIKWSKLPTKARAHAAQASSQADEPALRDTTFKFFVDAVQQSRAGKTIAGILNDANQLIEAAAKPDGVAAQALVRRFCDACNEHAFGDPRIFVRWQPFILSINRVDDSPGIHDEAWKFVASAINYQ